VSGAETGAMRFALLGCGDIGAKNAQALHQAHGVRLTTTFDPVTSLALELAERYGAVAADSVEAAVTSPDVDAVLIATPHDTHEAVAGAALDAGRHVLLEKPLAANLDAAVRIARTAQSGAGVVAVLFPLRLDPRFVRAAEAVESDTEGGLCGAASTYVIRKPARYFTGGYSNRSPSTWRRSKEQAGGGVLIMNVLHHIDAVRALLGREADTVLARTVPSIELPEIEDIASLIVDFGGALATFVGGASGFDGPGERVELWSPSLRVALLPDGMVSRADRGRSPETAEPPPPALDSRVGSIARFAQSVADGTQPPVPVLDALAVQAIVTAAYTSAAEARPVRVSDVLRDAGWQ
jgi:predicted dehydrogenase